MVLNSSYPRDLITVQIKEEALSNTIGFCLRFRYMIHGPGAQKFQVSIVNHHGGISPSWTDDDDTYFRWKYAYIPFMSPGPFQVCLNIPRQCFDACFYLIGKNNIRT